MLIAFGEGINDDIVLDHQKQFNLFLKAGIKVATFFKKMEKGNGRSLLAVQTGEEKQRSNWGRTSAAAVLSLSKLDFTFASEAMAFVRSPQKTLWSAFITASTTWALCRTDCSVVDSFLGEGSLTDRAQAARASALLFLVGCPPYSPRRFLTVAPTMRAGRGMGTLQQQVS